jgi:hypothetical protein
MFRARTLAAVVAVIVAVALGVFVGRAAPAGGRAPLAVAVASLPVGTTVVGFTDWRSILSRYSVARAVERDLSTRSALADADLAQMRAALGLRLSDLSWEAYGMDRKGDFAVVGVKDVPSAERLREAGYRLEGRIWRASGQIEIDEPLYRYVVPMPRRHVLVMSDGIAAVRHVAATINGRAPSLADRRDVADVARALAGSEAALIQAGELGCRATAAAIDADTVLQVRAAQGRFGKLVPYRLLGRGLSDDGTDLQRFVVAMPFGAAATASAQARIRAGMSTGPFIGRTGSMHEVLRLRSARNDGATAVLTYAHPANSDYLMPGRGPLLPASC